MAIKSVSDPLIALMRRPSELNATVTEFVDRTDAAPVAGSTACSLFEEIIGNKKTARTSQAASLNSLVLLALYIERAIGDFDSATS
ncbi:MAG: hypothetical protein ACJAQ4_002611 [Cryomorphaceae bacterium]|jgi:hypothetical protein